MVETELVQIKKILLLIWVFIIALGVTLVYDNDQRQSEPRTPSQIFNIQLLLPENMTFLHTVEHVSWNAWGTTREPNQTVPLKLSWT